MAKERFIVVVGRVVFGATALMADEVWMRNKQSVHLKARVMVRSEGIVWFWKGW